MEGKSRFKAEAKTGDIEGNNEKEEGYYGQNKVRKTESRSLRRVIERERVVGITFMYLASRRSLSVLFPFSSKQSSNTPPSTPTEEEPYFLLPAKCRGREPRV